MINLCKREQKIMKLLDDGCALDEIAKKLELSPRTIGFFMAEIKCKTGQFSSNPADLVEIK